MKKFISLKTICILLTVMFVWTIGFMFSKINHLSTEIAELRNTNALILQAVANQKQTLVKLAHHEPGEPKPDNIGSGSTKHHEAGEPKPDGKKRAPTSVKGQKVSTVQTLAIKNNNPLNIKIGGEKWRGQIGHDGEKHVIFESPEYGIRAAAITLKNYQQRHKIDTVEKIIKRFARGNVTPYINYVCQRLKVKKDQKIVITDRLPELLQAMTRWESGHEFPLKYFTPYDIVALL